MSSHLHDILARFHPELPWSQRTPSRPVGTPIRPSTPRSAALSSATPGRRWDEPIRCASRDSSSPPTWPVSRLSWSAARMAGLRGFFNVCRHRAARVVPEAEGRATRLRCRYHGWTYDLCGRLRGTPEFDGVADFRREDNGLPPVAVAEWGPIVWAHLGSQPEPLSRFLAPLPERAEALRLKSLRFVERREYRLACNWKVFVDNYLDGGYHVNTVHPGLAGVLDYSQYRTEIAGNTAVQISPLQAERRACRPSRRACRRQRLLLLDLSELHAQHLRRSDGHQSRAAAGAGCLPRGVRLLFPRWHAGRLYRRSIAVAEQIQMEDVGICEEVQRGMAQPIVRFGKI